MTSLYATFLTPLTSYPIGEYLENHPDVGVELERSIPMGRSTHYVWLLDNDHESLLGEIESGPFDSVEVVEALQDRALIRIEWGSQGPPVFGLINETFATLVGLHGTTEGWVFQLRFPDQASLEEFTEAAPERGISIDLLERFEPEDEIGPFDNITDRQFHAIGVAFEAGYFDVPRKTTLAVLGEQLGITEQAVSERLRRGLARLLETTSLGTADPGDDTT